MMWSVGWEQGVSGAGLGPGAVHLWVGALQAMLIYACACIAGNNIGAKANPYAMGIGLTKVEKA